MAKKPSQAQKRAQRLREYRSAYVLARKKGLVKDLGPGKNFKPSKYMKTKLNKIKPYLTAEYEAVRLEPKQFKAWKDKTNARVPVVTNKIALVKKEKGQKVKKTKYGFKLIEPLEAGTFEHVPLPIKAKDLDQLEQWINENDYYNDILKYENELFNFKIFGNPSYNSFGDIQSIIKTLANYPEFDQWPEDWVENHFELFRSYKDWKFQRDTPAYKKERQRTRRARQRARMTEKQRERLRQRDADQRLSRVSYGRQLEKEKKARKQETPEQREKRLDKMRKWREKNKDKITGYMRDYRKDRYD